MESAGAERPGSRARHGPRKRHKYRKLVDLVRNSNARLFPARKPMILLLAILTWTFLIVLVISLCVTAQRGDLGQSPNNVNASPVDRADSLALARHPDAGERWPRWSARPIGSDFGRLGFDLWPALPARERQTTAHSRSPQALGLGTRRNE